MQWHPLPGRQWQLHSKTPMQPMRREAVSRKLLRLLGTAVPPCLRISRPWQRQPGRPGI